jgi:hypothetical protein
LYSVGDEIKLIGPIETDLGDYEMSDFNSVFNKDK